MPEMSRDVLTSREWQVVAMLREGLTNDQIAERLGISRDGAKYHVSEIIGKLGLSNRIEAAAWYARNKPIRQRLMVPGWILTLANRGRAIGAASMSAALVITAGLALIVGLVAGLAIMTMRSGAALPASVEATPTRSPGGTPTESPAPPPTAPPVLSAHLPDDAQVWDTIIQLTAGNITPILRPSFLPPGIIDATIDRPAPGKSVDPRILQVKYEGPGVTLWIQAGRLNPAPPPVGGSQEEVTVRGHSGTLVVADTTMPAEHAWLYWQEPGRLIGEGGAPAEHWLYEVRADGLDPQMLLEVAESMHPYP